MKRREFIGVTAVSTVGMLAVSGIPLTSSGNNKEFTVSAKDIIGMKAILIDAIGKKIPNVKSWNLITNEAELYLASSMSDTTMSLVVVYNNGERSVKTIKTTLPGCKLVWKEDLKPVTKEEVKLGRKLS